MASVKITVLGIILGIVCSPTIQADFNITSPPVTDWGIWGIFEKCPPNSYAQGFQLKTEPNQYLGDDTALNAVRLFCGDPYRLDTAVINSTEGDFGEWGNIFTCFPGVLTGFQVRVEPNQWSGDDTATNNVRFFCSRSPDPVDYIEGDGMSWGSWTSSQHCYSNQAICGIQTQVEPYQGDDMTYQDDTMLNNIRLSCCDYNKVQHEKLMAQQEDDLTIAFQTELIYKQGISPRFAEVVRTIRAQKETSSSKVHL